MLRIPGGGNKLNTKILLKRFWWNFVKSFGVVWLFIEPATNFAEEPKDFGNIFYYAIVLLSLVISYFVTKPKTSLERSISGNNSKIMIEAGDLLEKKTHIIVGTNDVFDTVLGDVIKPASVQGQFTQKFYNSDIARLDAEIIANIQSKGISGELDDSKTKGKNTRYPVGTTIALGNAKKVFFSAYSYMNNNLKCESNADWLWHSMNEIWKEARLSGQGGAVSIPIIGSDLARTGLSRLALVQMIILSFVSANNTEFVSECLNVVIHPSDVEKLDFVALEHFLESIDV